MWARMRSWRDGESPVRNGDPEHRRKALDIQTVAQAQVPEFGLGQLAVDVTLRLGTKLRDSLVDKLMIEFVVSIHGSGDRIADGRERYQDRGIERTNHCLYQ